MDLSMLVSFPGKLAKVTNLSRHFPGQLEEEFMLLPWEFRLPIAPEEGIGLTGFSGRFPPMPHNIIPRV